MWLANTRRTTRANKGTRRCQDEESKERLGAVYVDLSGRLPEHPPARPQIRRGIHVASNPRTARDGLPQDRHCLCAENQWRSCHSSSVPEARNIFGIKVSARLDLFPIFTASSQEFMIWGRSGWGSLPSLHGGYVALSLHFFAISVMLLASSLATEACHA
jgi:hypothetical protein